MTYLSLLENIERANEKIRALNRKIKRYESQRKWGPYRQGQAERDQWTEKRARWGREVDRMHGVK